MLRQEGQNEWSEQAPLQGLIKGAKLVCRVVSMLLCATATMTALQLHAWDKLTLSLFHKGIFIHLASCFYL